MTSQAISIVIQLVSTVTLARLLTPEDYGTLAMVMAVTSFAGLFRDLGLSSAAIQKKDLTRQQQSNLFWLNVGTGTVLTVLLAATSPLVAWFYGKPELFWVTIALSTSFVIGSLGTQHGAMLARKMQFGRRATANIAGSLVTLCVAVTLALHGFEYWSLVWGNISGSIFTTCLLMAFSPLRPSLPRRGYGMREMITFGAHVTAFDVVNYFHRNLDSILIGRFWGSGALGFYSRAYSLLMFPIQAIRGPLNTVAYPAMSRLREEPVAFRAYYRRVSFLLAFASMPLTAFMFATSEDIIRLALGPKWLAVAPIFSALAFVGFIQPTASLRGLVLMSLGRSKRYVTWGMINAVCVSTGFLAGIKWGPLGIAYGYAISTYAILHPSMAYVFKDTPVKPLDFWTSIARPATASMAACALVILLQKQALFTPAAFTLLLLKAFAFTIAYTSAYLLLPNGRSDLRSLITMSASLKRHVPASS